MAECCRVTLGGCGADAGTKMTGDFDTRVQKTHTDLVNKNSHITVHACFKGKQCDTMNAADINNIETISKGNYSKT